MLKYTNWKIFLLYERGARSKIGTRFCIERLKMHMELHLHRVAPEERKILENVAEYYVYDFSEYLDLEIRPDGRFGFHSLIPYWNWNDPGRQHAFFIRIGGNIAGFVLIENLGPDTANLHSIAEFFVAKKYRRHGVGKMAAIKAFDMFGGQWEVMQIEKNARARAFWHKVIGEYTNGRFEERFYDGKYYQKFFARV